MVNTRSVRAGNSSQPLGRGQVPSNLPPHLPPPIPHMFPSVDHVEGEDENQPHNSAHNSASTANQDVVAAQLATMQQQFGVFQLVLAQLLARNNPGDPLINLLNLAPQPLARQQNPELVQHAPALSESQVVEQRGAPPPHHAADSIPHPLNTNITLEPYPTSFRIPQLETYDGTKDPDDHLHAFYSCMQNHNASDTLMCKIFPSTLRGNAQTWYYSLPPRSISSYIELASSFAIKFSNRRLINKTTSELITQLPLRTKTPTGEMRIRARTDEDSTEPRSDVDLHTEIRKVELSTPTTICRRPGSMRTAAASRDHTRYCDFHQDHGNTTEQCNSLRFELESLTQKGMLNEYIQRAEQPRFVREQGQQPQGVRNPPNRQGVGHQQAPPPLPPQARIIHMITGGLEAGGMSSKQRKLPTLTEIRAVVSQSHLCMKFPTPMGTATLRGNQEVARHYYLTLVTRPQKDKDQPAKNPPQEIHDNRQVMGVEILDNRPEDETLAAPGEDVEEVQIDDRDPTNKTQMGTRLNPENRAELITFLRANKDAFAWTSADMPGIPTSVIKEEVEKLLQAGFVRRVDYCEWVANPVLVKKANGKWQICIDYTNLNQACPKDCYPMPNIDKLVEAASGNERLSLLDAYSGYHQVPMALEDEEKTSFYAGDEIYCYVMMPFGLKNAVVKSLKAKDHLTDLEETFNNLRKNRMRLNPAKCIFGVELGKFLGFMVSRRGIEVNPEKIKAVAEMEPPKSPPLLTKANDGEILYLYLSISDEAISSVLVREEGKQQKRVYYTSSMLHGAEIRYSIAEKAALVVVTSARKLRPYFQSHPIIVLTDQPLRHILQKPNKIDKLGKCTSAHSGSQSEVDSWILYVDGASSNKGSGAGAILLGPDGYQSEHALKFNFDATNNMVKYEALLLSLQLATKLKVAAIQIYSDSQLVVTQVNSICEVVDPVMMNTEPSTPSWTDPIVSFLGDETVPTDKQEKMRLRKKASRYTLVNDVLYKRSFSLLLLRCLNPYEAEYALREVHEGVCGNHIGARTLAHKVLRQGYYWPNMYKDATQFVQRCSFMKGVGGVTHLIVGVDYFTKWVEARPLSSLTSKKVEYFVFSSIICRYGIPNQIVADNGTQFNCSSFRDFCSSYGIKLQFTSVYHPESNGMVESVNKVILEGIKPRLELHKARWADELNNVLWAYKTTSRTATGETPYHLAFGTEAVIPIEIRVPSFRVTHFDEGRNVQLLRENLDLLDEVREEARLRTLVCLILHSSTLRLFFFFFLHYYQLSIKGWREDSVSICVTLPPQLDQRSEVSRKTFTILLYPFFLLAEGDRRDVHFGILSLHLLSTVGESQNCGRQQVEVDDVLKGAGVEEVANVLLHSVVNQQIHILLQLRHSFLHVLNVFVLSLELVFTDLPLTFFEDKPRAQAPPSLSAAPPSPSTAPHIASASWHDLSRSSHTHVLER
ncbi:hypothetical protein SLEP1_g41667 [Rubroshorea leprosula]|uniref:Integrase catalytic domain-containing protein n=1 Tax=Rubroshorea leprosula TaxID=152421 RepID=A0AAV5L7F2_9ROSI|nr:hypothetical protein SLEP1_g41667 [Rubroshorea leprosula]